MARPGTQNWAAKDEWGFHTESHTQQEPGTLAGALKVIDLRSGVGREGSGGVSPSRWPLPASAPGGWAPLTRRPFAPLMPGGPRDPGGPCGGRKSLEKPPFRPLEVRPSSVSPDPAQSRGAPPPTQDPSPLRGMKKIPPPPSSRLPSGHYDLDTQPPCPPWLLCRTGPCRAGSTRAW